MDIIQLVIATITLIVAIIAAFFAFKIPRKIMIDQRYSDLLKEYRSSEMGVAILSVFRFYTRDCKSNIDRIVDEYKKKYKAQIGDPLARGETTINYSQTLHFQRRLISQFYYDMACLRYNECCPRLSTKQLLYWFTPREVPLLAIVLHMAKPSMEVFEKAENVPDPKYRLQCTSHDNKVLSMNEMLYKLYKEAKELVKKLPSDDAKLTYNVNGRWGLNK
ncbi:MAG: hypothetical protein LBK25_04125 [Treponema sp.]|nr:hypothetical protein [Treponema sp.]